MTVSATTRIVRAFEDRAEALAHFFARAGAAPRLLAYDDAAGCPLDQALAALEWTAAVGLLHDDDLVHAARLSPDSGAVVVERRDATTGSAAYVFFGPRTETALADASDGELLYDEPGVRAFRWAERAPALGHFLRATLGQSALIALLGRRAPEVRHIRRWTQVLFTEHAPGESTALLAGWFATGGAGYLFLPGGDGPYMYREVAIEG